MRYLTSPNYRDAAINPLERKPASILARFDNVTRIFPTFLLFWCCGLRHWACLSDDNALTFESRANALGALDFNMIMRPRLRTVDL